MDKYTEYYDVILISAKHNWIQIQPAHFYILNEPESELYQNYINHRDKTKHINFKYRYMGQRNFWVKYIDDKYQNADTRNKLNTISLKNIVLMNFLQMHIMYHDMYYLVPIF